MFGTLARRTSRSRGLSSASAASRRRLPMACSGGELLGLSAGHKAPHTGMATPLARRRRNAPPPPESDSRSVDTGEALKELVLVLPAPNATPSNPDGTSRRARRRAGQVGAISSLARSMASSSDLAGTARSRRRPLRGSSQPRSRRSRARRLTAARLAGVRMSWRRGQANSGAVGAQRQPRAGSRV